MTTSDVAIAIMATVGNHDWVNHLDSNIYCKSHSVNSKGLFGLDYTQDLRYVI